MSREKHPEPERRWKSISGTSHVVTRQDVDEHDTPAFLIGDRLIRLVAETSTDQRVVSQIILTRRDQGHDGAFAYVLDRMVAELAVESHGIIL